MTAIVADSLSKLELITGNKRQSIILFCKNNSISYPNLITWYLKFGRNPNQWECSMIRKSGDTWINSIPINSN